MNRAWSIALAGMLLATMVAGFEREDHDPPEADSLIVMTYNVHQGYAEESIVGNAHQIASVIRDSGAHVIGLQETETGRLTSGQMDLMGWLADELEMHLHRGPPTKEAVYGIALLSAWPIYDTEWWYLPNPESIERTAIHATVATPRGPVPFIVTHLSTDLFPEDRRQQAQDILERVDDRTIALADWNTEPHEEPYTMLASAMQDVWISAGNPETGAATYPASAPDVRIDHIFAGNLWPVTAAWLAGDERASDHRAVVAELEWPV